MKSIFLFVLSALFLFPVKGQDTYTLKMSIKSEGLPAEYAAMGEMDVVVYVKGEKTKSETSSMMFNRIVYFDGKVLTSLMDGMGNKTGYSATKEEIEAMDKNKSADTKPSIEYINDKRTIAGYECSKAVVKSIDKDKKERVSVIWYTEKIKPLNSTVAKSNRRSMPIDLSDLKGTPLAMEFMSNFQGMELKTIMMTNEVSTDVIDDSVFVPKTEGYSMMTLKEFQEKMRAMGGGPR